MAGRDHLTKAASRVALEADREANRRQRERGRRLLQAMNGTWDQRSLGDAVGATQSTVSLWVAGERAMSVDMVQRVAQVLGCAPAWLAWGEPA